MFVNTQRTDRLLNYYYALFLGSQLTFLLPLSLVTGMDNALQIGIDVLQRSQNYSTKVNEKLIIANLSGKVYLNPSRVTEETTTVTGELKPPWYIRFWKLASKNPVRDDKSSFQSPTFVMNDHTRGSKLKQSSRLVTLETESSANKNNTKAAHVNAEDNSKQILYPSQSQDAFVMSSLHVRNISNSRRRFLTPSDTIYRRPPVSMMPLYSLSDKHSGGQKHKPIVVVNNHRGPTFSGTFSSGMNRIRPSSHFDSLSWLSKDKPSSQSHIWTNRDKTSSQFFWMNQMRPTHHPSGHLHSSSTWVNRISPSPQISPSSYWMHRIRPQFQSSHQSGPLIIVNNHKKHHYTPFIKPTNQVMKIPSGFENSNKLKGPAYVVSEPITVLDFKPNSTRTNSTSVDEYLVVSAKPVDNKEDVGQTGNISSSSLQDNENGEAIKDENILNNFSIEPVVIDNSGGSLSSPLPTIDSAYLAAMMTSTPQPPPTIDPNYLAMMTSSSLPTTAAGSSVSSVNGISLPNPSISSLSSAIPIANPLSSLGIQSSPMTLFGMPSNIMQIAQSIMKPSRDGFSLLTVLRTILFGVLLLLIPSGIEGLGILLSGISMN